MKVPTKLTEAQAAILSLLASEFPPDPVHPWVRMEVDYDGTVGYSGQVGGQTVSVAPFGDGGWAVRGLDMLGIGRTIPAAIGDFRVKVAAAAAAVGAIPKAPA